MENQDQVFHPSHRPWKSLRDSHIPTALTTVPIYKDENQARPKNRLAKQINHLGWAKLKCRSGPNVVAKRRGCPRIAQQIALAFAVEIDKDVVRRILSVHYRPASGDPSWLTFLGHTKDSLWSCDLFRCESATLRTHWVLVVMDQCTRRVIGFGVHCGIVDGVALCRMFHRAIRGQRLAKYLS